MDKLDALREAVAELRDLEADIDSMTKALETLTDEKNKLQRETLPQLFMEAGVTKIGLEGDELEDRAPCDYVLAPYYHANIAANWPDEKREQAFKHLEDAGFGDIIKQDFNVLLPKGDYKSGAALMGWLEEQGYTYKKKLNVPWTTLTAVVKEQVEKGNLQLDLQLIGADIGNIVKRKKEK